MPMQTWDSVLNSPVPAGGTATSSITTADISPIPQFFLPANYLYPGAALRLTAFGTFSTSGTTPTLILGFYYGAIAGIALCATTALTLTNQAAVAWPWRLEATAHVRTVGTSGSIMCNGFIDWPSALAAWTHRPVPETAPGSTVAIDTTATKAITVGATFSASASTNIVTCHQFLVESLA